MFRNLLEKFAYEPCWLGPRRFANVFPRQRVWLCWLGTVLLARNRFPNTHQLKHTSFQNDQLCKDTFFCVLNKTWTRSNAKKFLLNAGREDAALSECRNATTFCHSQHANALFSKELGTLANSIVFTLSSPLEILLSPHPRRSLTFLAVGRQLHHT